MASVGICSGARLCVCALIGQCVLYRCIICVRLRVLLHLLAQLLRHSYALAVVSLSIAHLLQRLLCSLRIGSISGDAEDGCSTLARHKERRCATLLCGCNVCEHGVTMSIICSGRYHCVAVCGE